jgi:hypothetical protein
VAETIHSRVMRHHNFTDCAICADGYTRSTRYQCTKCKGATDNVTIAVMVVIAAIILAVCYYVMSDLMALDTMPIETKCFSKTLQRAKQIPWNKLRIPIVVMQLLTQFIAITGTQYPSIYGDYLKWLDVINLDVSWLLSAGCILRVSFYVKLLCTTLAPLLVATVKHLSVFLTFTFLIYSTVSTVVFQTFACDTFEDTKQSWLRADYSISCNTDKHTAYKVYAAVMIAVYPIGIPVLYAVLLWRHRHSLNPASSTTAKSEGLRALLSRLLCSCGQYHSSTTATTTNATTVKPAFRSGRCL